MKKADNISNAELEVMQTLWAADEPMSVQDVCDSLENSKWKYKTVGTLLIRLEEKGAVKADKRGRTNFYTPLLDREEYKKAQTDDLVSKLYNGSARELAVSLFTSGKMTESDIEEIRKMFDL